ncbi:MAG: hypothetical protein HY276_11070 [Ignavibacteriales bacterium]|nr:hypothetical protein [Ignavibacteriales bacterium]MBI3788781.1 hypothetical protein [Ignavibacteriales bacterium]
MKKKTTFAFILLMTLLSFSCKDEVANPDTNPIVFPDANVSYSKHVEALFQQRCALAGCHAGGNAQAGLDLLQPSYSKLINHQPRLVVSGASNNSLIVQRIDGRVPPQMPFNQAPLTTNQINGIRKWIDEGAQNN